MTTQGAVAQPNLILTLSCPDKIGIVAEVARFLVDHGCNIIESGQFGDTDNGQFFMRTAFTSTAGVTLDQLKTEFAPIKQRFAMDARLHDQRTKLRTILMVSKFGHCLNDLLFRWKIGALPIEIVAIVSNHTDFADTAKTAGVPFYHRPITKDNKAEQEQALDALIASERAGLIVLARYMQVLSTEFCGRYPAQIVNIHHSFLPSFKGAKPYHQAHARGVKLIGATAHFVTEDLDEGPIIEQEVERVAHNLSAEDYVAVGRDTESVVLARAVKWCGEHRVLLNGCRTVVFQ